MSAAVAFFEQDTIVKLIDYSMEVAHLGSPDEVLNRLHEIASERTRIRVHGASRFSVKFGDWRRIKLGKTVFFHKDVPRGRIEEWTAFVTSGHPLGLMAARRCLASFTWKELSAMLDPVGVDRWPFELALKHGLRDGYLCPVGGRWVVGFWSPGVLENGFTHQARGLLNMASSAAAIRLEKLIGDDVSRVGSRASLTQRGGHTAACCRWQNSARDCQRPRLGGGNGA
jgi:LuxR family quorum sensing-dependent transcriptional regulator